MPLASPDDVLFNSTSVGLVILLVGAVNGFLWHWATPANFMNRRYAMSIAALGLGSLAIALSAQTQFDRAASFTVPLVVTGVVITAALTPFLARTQKGGIWIHGLLVLVAVALSIGLAGQGDQESGSLSLPPPP
ncbi:MAG: hypothetical protein O3B95_10265 [Chloroflexi bacterium]|nr:hypothetical protein [Chloroflexota bacterium]